jgi:hypothetical protein
MTVQYKPEFKGFGKIPRFNRDIVITEEIDGTNALICIDADNDAIFAGSKNRWIKEGEDNFGFNTWVKQNEEELKGVLGPGYHYGEWWGQGIQRGYGLDHKRFSLFNTYRWDSLSMEIPRRKTDLSTTTLLNVVPVLYEGPLIMEEIEEVRNRLKIHGSYAAPGFMEPEGIVIYHTTGKCLFKWPYKDGAKDLENKRLEEEQSNVGC